MSKGLRGILFLVLALISMSVGFGFLMGDILFKNSNGSWGVICFGLGVFILLMVISGDKSRLDSHMIAQRKSIKSDSGENP
jgi:hypothetical protein